MEKEQEWCFRLSLFPFLWLLQLQARSQLRLAGLFPSAYWCGQALVDIPFFWSLMCLMFGTLVLFTRICPLEAKAVLTLVSSGQTGWEQLPSLISQHDLNNLFAMDCSGQVFIHPQAPPSHWCLSLSLSLQITCMFGYGISLVLFVYVMAFTFRMGRSNRYIWSLIFILVSEEHLPSEIFDLHALPLGALFQICINKFQFISIFSRITWITCK